MGRRVVLLFLLLAVALPGLAQSTKYEHDEEADLASFKTFAWRNHDEDLEQADPKMHGWIVESVRDRFSESGLRYVESNPDLWVTYYASSKEETQIRQRYIGSRFSGSARTVDSEVKVELGTLILELEAGDTGEVVWRATGNKYLSKKDATNQKRVDKLVGKLVKNWDKLYRP